jgi:hypothetical protein
MATDTQPSSESRVWWSINVTGYGRFEHFGFAHEAEEMRDHKADWEGGIGTKRKATEKEIAKARAEVLAMVARGYGWDRTSPREIESIRDAFGGTLPDGVELVVLEKDDE